MADLSGSHARCGGLRPPVDVLDARRQLRVLTEALGRLPVSASRTTGASATRLLERDLAQALHVSIATSRIRLVRLRTRVQRAIESLDTEDRVHTEGAHHGP